jgi:NADH-quinone oxidoreductase subunit H
MRDIVMAQYDQGMWFIFYVPIGFFIYMVGSIAETNRAPFDLPEAESELVAGYMTEYSGFRWSLYFLAEYANMIIVAGIATTLFLGGWLRPFASYHDHLPGTPIELLDALPSLLVLGVAVYCFFLAPKQPVKIQKLVMALVGGLCLAIAGIFGRRAVCVPGRAARRPRRVLVHGQGVGVPLLLFVVSVYVSAVPLRSIDASRVAISDPAGAG